MTSKIKCAEYRYITKWVWDLSEEEEKNMMTLPSSSNVPLDPPKPEMKTELLKCIPLQNQKDNNGKVQQRFRYLACVAVGDGNGSIGIGEKIANSRKVAESKAGKEALRNVRFVGKHVINRVDSKCQDVSLSLIPAPSGIVSGSPLAKKLLEITGMSGCSVTGSDNTLSTVRALDKALKKLI